MSPDSERPDPQSPAPSGPQSPAPGGPQFAPPSASAPAPESPAAPNQGAYGGPVPPGGWQQPIASAQQPGIAAQGQLAGWGGRLGAYVIDALILSVPFLVVFFALIAGAVGLTGTGNEDVAVGAIIGAMVLSGLAFFVIALLYAPLLMKRGGERNGQTWGKQILNIRAVRDNGQAWTFGSAALREVVLKGLAVAIASSIIPLIPWLLNFCWPLWDDQNRALHDMAASSHVVKA